MTRSLALFLCVAFALRPEGLFAQRGNPGVTSPPVQSAQQSTRQADTGVIRGRVLRADTGAPLSRAEVVVTGAQIREQISVTADDRGRFELRDLPPGRYNLRASKPGYVQTSYGQRTPTPIDLAERQVVDSINVSLPRAGAIEGRVVDEHGEPVVEAQVILMRGRYVDGVRRLNSGYVTTMATDDLGRFRLFGLAANTYYLMVFPDVGRGTADFKPATYFPGTLVPAEAQPIELGAGQDIGGLVVQLVTGRLATVSAIVTSSDGQPARIGSASLRDGGSVTLGTRRPGVGSFSIPNVPPGSYTLSVQTEAREAVETAVTVGSGDLTLTLVTAAGGTVKGRIAFEPGMPPGITPENVSVTLAGVSFANLQVAKDWTFAISDVIGTGVIQVSGRRSSNPTAPLPNPDAWMLKGVFHRGVDITDTPTDSTAGMDELEVVLTTRVTRLIGTVTDRRGGVVRDAAVVLFPDDPSKWTARSRFIRTARPNQSGQFTAAALPPGRYLGAAVEFLEAGDEREPLVLERLRRSAAAVTLGEGDQKSITVKLSELQ